MDTVVGLVIADGARGRADDGPNGSASLHILARLVGGPVVISVVASVIADNGTDGGPSHGLAQDAS